MCRHSHTHADILTNTHSQMHTHTDAHTYTLSHTLARTHALTHTNTQREKKRYEVYIQLTHPVFPATLSNSMPLWNRIDERA